MDMPPPQEDPNMGGGGFDDFSGGEDMGSPDDGSMDDDLNDENEESPIKRIQKLTGKLGQRIREAYDQQLMDDSQVKYVMNSIISAIKFNEVDGNVKESIIDKIQNPDDGMDDGGEGQNDMGGENEFNQQPEQQPMGQQQPAPNFNESIEKLIYKYLREGNRMVNSDTPEKISQFDPKKGDVSQKKGKKVIFDLEENIDNGEQKLDVLDHVKTHDGRLGHIANITNDQYFVSFDDGMYEKYKSPTPYNIDNIQKLDISQYKQLAFDFLVKKATKLLKRQSEKTVEDELNNYPLARKINVGRVLYTAGIKASREKYQPK